MRRRSRFAPVAVAAGLGLLATPGCGPGSEPRSVTVFAASSLTDVLGELAERFEAAHPEVDVELSFAGSQVLRLQIEQGAATDLFVSANEQHMRALVETGDMTEPRIIATSDLVIVVPPDNPARIEDVRDLTRASRIVIGTEFVPVGAYTRELLSNVSERDDPGFADAVLERVASMESNVRIVRAKVLLGEADVGIVYRSDAVSSEELRVIPIPDAVNERARFSAAIATRSSQSADARRLLDYLSSDEAARVFDEHGFGAGPR